MFETNIWHKLIIHRKKIIFILFILWACGHSNAQDASFNKRTHWVDKNLPYYDDKLLHYGFTIGINSTRFKATESSNYTHHADSIVSITSPSTPGFSLGFILNLKLNRFMDLRLLPTVAFYQRDVNFTYAGGSVSKQTTESTFIEIPLMLKYKSERRGNGRMYMIAGVKPAIEAGAKRKEKKDTDLRTQNIDFSVDYGFGFDIYYPLFKFSPEIRFSHGFRNLLFKDPNPYSQSLTHLMTHTVTLYFNFE